MKPLPTHDHPVPDFHAVAMPSDRSIGRLFGVVALVFSVWRSHFWSGLQIDAMVIAALLLGVVFLLAGQFSPQLLAPLNKLWMGLGALLGKIISPLVLFMLYVAVIVPAGLLRQWFAKPAIHRGKDPTLQSYWVLREPPGPKPETLNRPY